MALAHEKWCRCSHCNRRRRKALPAGTCRNCCAAPAAAGEHICATCLAHNSEARERSVQYSQIAKRLEHLADTDFVGTLLAHKAPLAPNEKGAAGG